MFGHNSDTPAPASMSGEAEASPSSWGGNLSVVRSDGTVEDDWVMDSQTVDDDGTVWVTVAKSGDYGSDDDVPTKVVRWDVLDSWQTAANGKKVEQAGLLSEVKQPLIDQVPQNAAEVATLAEKAAEVKRAPLLAQADALLAQIKADEAHLSPKDQLAMWKYASGAINQREAQKRGNHQDAKNEGQNAQAGYNELSSAGREALSHYTQQFNQLHAITAQIAAI